MDIKWIGAIFIVVGSGGLGLKMAAAVRAEDKLLSQLARALEYMAGELEFRLTPLPELCRKTAGLFPGPIGGFFTALAQELERQISPEAASCVEAALRNRPGLPESVVGQLREMGRTLGALSLEGQTQALSGVIDGCQSCRKALEDGKLKRLRSYQTLGLCAGAALAILLL